MKLKCKYLIFVFFLVTTFPFLSCADKNTIPNDIALQQAYRDAIEDARIAEPDEISRNLTAIVYYNDALIWESDPGSSPVLVVTWTSWDGYNDKVGQSVTVSRDTWVTAVPEIKNFTDWKRLSDEKRTLRLEQLLGIPPENGKQWFVEMWANPDDLFRPSPDPDITDHEAELDFPKYITDEYKQWFNELQMNSYGENGYPWTRLGYTYNWGNPESEIGLSEFVIKSGSEINIHSVSNTNEYFQ